MPSRDQFKTNGEYNAYFREYRKDNLSKLRKYQRIYMKKNRKKWGYAPEKKWRIENPEKVSAQKKLQRAVRSGKIKKEKCVFCKSINAIAHHPNYSEPLKVIWVCKPHHRAIHYAGYRKSAK